MAGMVVMVLSCNDDKDDLMKEKEQRLLRQYLESRNIDAEPEKSGLYFLATQEGAGAMPERNDWVIIRYTAKMINDRVFDTTEEITAVSNNIHSQSVLYGDRRIDMSMMGLRGVLEGLMMMKEGGAATLIIPSHLAYGSKGSGIVPPYSTIIYEIELVKVIKNIVEYEEQLINNYLALYNDSTHLVIQEHNGIHFIELYPGTGENYPGEKDRVSLYYRGTFTDGRVFDSNMPSGPLFEFPVGGSQAIEGFEEGVKLMKKDGRARVLIPSSLGYGAEGTRKIPGYTPLVFDLELVDIKVHEE